MNENHDSGPVLHHEPEERDYFLKRAEDHRQLAENADPSGTRPIHLRFEQLYRDRAARLG